MEQFATEEQQVEAIKRFWKENGMAIVIGAVVGLGGLWGWRYYNETTIVSQQAASDKYQQFSQQLSEDSSVEAAKAFVNANRDSGYSQLTAMQLAQKAVTDDNLEEAAKQLAFILEQGNEGGLVSLAALRLGRVQLAQQQLDKALATLGKIEGESYVAQVEELKGDIYVAQKQFDKARVAYGSALEKAANNNLLKMKLDNLSVTSNG